MCVELGIMVWVDPFFLCVWYSWCERRELNRRYSVYVRTISTHTKTGAVHVILCVCKFQQNRKVDLCAIVMLFRSCVCEQWGMKY
jgi:hypothetical protein